MDPLTVGTLAVSGMASLAQGGLVAAASGVVGNAADRLVKRMLRATEERVKGLDGMPENHHVARSVRTAQIAALRQVVLSYQATLEPPEAAEQRFVDAALTFCDDALRVLRRGHTLELQVTASLSKSINSILTGASGGDPADRSVKLRALSEDAVLRELRDELREGLAPHGKADVLPTSFVKLFRVGGAGSDPFMEVFGGFIAAELKDKREFYRIYTTGQMAKLREDVERIEHRFAPILEQIRDEVAMIRHLREDLRLVMAKVDAMHRSPPQTFVPPPEIDGLNWERADSFFDTFWRPMLNRWKQGGLDYLAGTATQNVPRRARGWLMEFGAIRSGVDLASVVAANLSREDEEVQQALRTRGFAEIEKVYARFHMICVNSGVIEVLTLGSALPIQFSDEAPLLERADPSPDNADRVRSAFLTRVQAAREAQEEQLLSEMRGWAQDPGVQMGLRADLEKIYAGTAFAAPAAAHKNRVLSDFTRALVSVDVRTGSDLSKRLLRYVCPWCPPLEGRPISDPARPRPRSFSEAAGKGLPSAPPVSERITLSLEEQSDPAPTPYWMNRYLGDTQEAKRYRKEDERLLLNAFRFFRYSQEVGVDPSVNRARLSQSLQAAKSRVREVLSRPARHEWVREFSSPSWE